MKAIIEESKKRFLHLYATDSEYAEIDKAIKENQKTDLGKLRHGDVVRLIMLEKARKK